MIPVLLLAAALLVFVAAAHSFLGAISSGAAMPDVDARITEVVLHTTLCHVPRPEGMTTEAFRVLRPRGWNAVYRGADVLVQTGRLGACQAEALKDEARRPSAGRAWFGHIAFASVLGRKPA
jgi:hypothetical protein